MYFIQLCKVLGIPVFVLLAEDSKWACCSLMSVWVFVATV